MFPNRKFNYKHLCDHCQSRFGVTPQPYQLVNTWHCDNLESTSYLLFTNGFQDIWSGGSVLWNISETVVALNFENGAHHSELRGPTMGDTADIKNGFLQISNTLNTWLSQLADSR
jgi:lysosomal Pro-X carboxypeptidase